MTGSLQLLNYLRLTLRGHAGVHVLSRNADLRGDRLRNLRGVTGEQDRLQAELTQLRHGLGGLRLGGVGNRNHADRLQSGGAAQGLTVRGIIRGLAAGDNHRRQTRPASLIQQGQLSLAQLRTRRLQVLGGTHHNQLGGAAFDAFTRAAQHAAHASGNTLKAAHARHRNALRQHALLTGKTGNRASNRVLTQRLHGGGITQNRQGTLVLGTGRIRRNTGQVTRRLIVTKGAVERHRHLAGRHGTGLIQHHAINRARRLQHLRITNQNAQLPAATRTRQQRRRSSQTQSARARHHQYRHRRIKRRRTVTRNQPPTDQGQRRNHQNHRHKHRRNTIRQASNRSLRLLRARHQLTHLRQSRLSAHTGRTHRQRTRRIHRRTRDRIARMHLHRHRLTRQQGRIHRRRALNYHTIRGNLLTRAHQEQVIRHEVLHRNLNLLRHALLIGAQQSRLLRTHTQQGAQRLRRTVASAVLNRATNQQEQRHHGRRIKIQRRMVAGKHRPETTARMMHMRRQRRVHE